MGKENLKSGELQVGETVWKLLSCFQAVLPSSLSKPNCQQSSDVSFAFQGYGREIPIWI